MNATAFTAATWPYQPDLHTRRWTLQLLAGLTDELAAVSHSHHLLTRLLQHPDPLPPDTQLAQALSAIRLRLNSHNDSLALLNLVRPHHPHLHQLLDTTFQRRREVRIELHHLITPWQFASACPLTIQRHRLRPVLDDLHTRIGHIGQDLVRADRVLTRQITAGSQGGAPKRRDNTPS